ncbi:GTP binding protein [Aureococcus anophagefferens]|uniref:GTP binding protein n=1 Tax=Aureococcus anophagefferens TaxID=44056 RepID=A0ABR1GFE4_AURAN
MFNTSKLTRRNTQNQLESAGKITVDDNPIVVGMVTKGDCTNAAEGEAPVPYHGSAIFGFIARRSTKNAHAVEWPEGTIQQHPEEHATGGEITHGECGRRARSTSPTPSARSASSRRSANAAATMGIVDKIKELEAEYARTQKNKATEGHLGIIKAKLSKLRSSLLEEQSSSGGGGDGFDVKKSGDGRSEAAGYEFTTLTCIPGNILYNDTKIQLLDLPGIIEGAAHGKGRGKEVIAVARRRTSS